MVFSIAGWGFSIDKYLHQKMFFTEERGMGTKARTHVKEKSTVDFKKDRRNFLYWYCVPEFDTPESLYVILKVHLLRTYSLIRQI
jgi:hypothetical protein